MYVERRGSINEVTVRSNEITVRSLSEELHFPHQRSNSDLNPSGGIPGGRR